MMPSALQMLSQKNIANARPHLTLFSFWNWGLPLLIRIFCGVCPWLAELLASIFRGLVQIYYSMPSPLNMTLYFHFYFLFSLLAAVALRKWKMKKNKGGRCCFKWSALKSALQVNPAKVNLHDCCKCSCWGRSLERPAPMTHFKHTIPDSWQKSHYGHSFFLRTAEQWVTTYLQIKSSSINSTKLNHSRSGLPWAVLKPCAWLTD